MATKGQQFVSSGDKDFPVKKHLTYREKMDTAIELVARSFVIDEEWGTMTEVFEVDMVRAQVLASAFITGEKKEALKNMDVYDYADQHHNLWAELYADDSIKNEAEEILDIAGTIARTIRAETEAHADPLKKLARMTNEMPDTEEIKNATSEAAFLANDLLEARSLLQKSHDKEQKFSVGGQTLSFAKK